jgi:hypothetical protein
MRWLLIVPALMLAGCAAGPSDDDLLATIPPMTEAEFMTVMLARGGCDPVREPHLTEQGVRGCKCARARTAEVLSPQERRIVIEKFAPVRNWEPRQAGRITGPMMQKLKGAVDFCLAEIAS